jgi:hypothetical protein
VGDRFRESIEGSAKRVAGKLVSLCSHHQKRPAERLQKFQKLLVTILRGNIQIDQGKAQRETASLRQVRLNEA